jgi:hypothetical protein
LFPLPSSVSWSASSDGVVSVTWGLDGAWDVPGCPLSLTAGGPPDDPGDDAGACLVTQAAPGVPASTLEADALQRAWPSVVAAVRALHSLTIDRCPFDRTLARMMPLARASVAEDRVVVEFLPEALRRTSPTRILEGIEAELPARLDQERTELVVCHGDLCLPNVLVDPATDRVTALIDLAAWGPPIPTATSLCSWPLPARRGRTKPWHAGRTGGSPRSTEPNSTPHAKTSTSGWTP